MDPSLIEPRPGSQQLGKYRLVATLGQGGMGTVYLALASGVGQFRKLLVVKELLPELTRKEGFVEMFLDEAQLAARLDHPNVVQTFEAGQEAGRYFLAMEYLDGQPLSVLLERLKDRGGLPLPVQLHILSEVLAGLQYAHELRDYDGSSLHVVHRDVSPQNVFVTYHGQVKVVDFGVAKAANASALTHPGVFKGKFGYAAPEQILGRPVDARADVFAVGVMLWQAIAGRRFSQPVPTPESFRARATGAEPRIAAIVPSVDPLLADICDSALAVDPDERLRSAQEFRDDLVDYQILTRTRVEPAEIATLMREVFANERRVVHQVIEQAMKHHGATQSMVASLPFLQRDAEKVPTSLADLSRLIEVSVACDDDEIRRRYERSMAVPAALAPVLPPPPAGERTDPASTSKRGSARRSLVLAASGFTGVLALAWASTALLGGEPELAPGARGAAPAREQAVDHAALSPAAPASPGGAVLTGSAVPASPQPAAEVEAPPLEPDRRRVQSTVTRELLDELDREPVERGTQAARAKRPEVRLDPAQPEHSAPAPARGAPERPSVSEVEMGADLRAVRRSQRLRIDVEDPYR